MPLTLVTGPANSAKAGVVLRAFREELSRAAAGRAAEPVLVVPTAADVEPYQRELADSGTVFGGEVLTFNRLVREIAARTGYDGRALGPVARDRVVRAAIRDARPLGPLAESAASPGFAPAVARLFDELQRASVSPERFTRAIRDWGGSPHGEDLATLYRAYHARLAALGRVDAEGATWGALRALRADPAAWGGRGVFFYGFDDLTPAQLDAVETLVRGAGVPVVVAVAYEPGRAAFAGRAGTVEALRALADRVEALEARDEYYAAASRPALHHLERHLFEAPPRREEPGDAVRLLEAGGERAEAELVGAEVLELLRAGMDPADVAVLVRTDEEGPLIEQVLGAYGVPVARAARVPLAATRLGAGVLAFLRCGTAGGSAADLVGWLRTPGKLPDPAPADGLEALVRRHEVGTAREARRAWERAHPALRELDALAGAAEQDVPAVLDVLAAELESIWTSPHRRSGAVLDPAAEDDARVAAELRGAFAELRGLAALDAALVEGVAIGGADDAARRLTAIAEALSTLEVRLAAPTAGVLVTDPLAVRARRFRAVFVCGLQDGAFPRRPAPDPFLSDAERRDLAKATGIVLGFHEDVLDAERHLFYAALSRAQEVVFCSYRSSDEEGEPQVPSPFVADLRDLFTDALFRARGRRLLAEVTWPPADAPTELELRRSIARATPGQDPPPLAPLGAPAVLARLAARDCEPAAQLEAFAACGVRWLVESLLRPRRIEPDPEPMQRGSLAHGVLERTLRALKERTGSARLTPERIDEAHAELAAAMRELGATAHGALAQASLRALEADLRRVLRHEAEHGPGLEPELFEWSFGNDGDDDGPVAIADDVRVRGRVDRVDVGGGVAVVRDYKNSKAYPWARWTEDRRIQVALYALAVREHHGLRPAAALYQPLRGDDLRARGLVADGTSAVAGTVGTDVADPAEFAARLDAMRDEAVAAARGMREGRVVPCPERCTSRGCAYPSICRVGDRAVEVDA